MGQKVNPISLRLGVNRTWDSRWYADEEFTDYLHEDLKIRKFLKEKLAQAGISKIVIERPTKKARVTIHSAHLNSIYIEFLVTTFCTVFVLYGDMKLLATEYLIHGHFLPSRWDGWAYP